MSQSSRINRREAQLHAPIWLTGCNEPTRTVSDGPMEDNRMALPARSYNSSLDPTVLWHVRPLSSGALCPLNPAPTHQYGKGKTNFSFDPVKLDNT